MKNQKKACFGILDEVFPVGRGGLREVPSRCFECPDRTECLRAALETQEGLAFQARRLRRAERHGLVGWIQRWSEKKALSQRMKESGGRRK